MDPLPDPSDDLINAGAAAVAQRGGMSATEVTNAARQLLREEGFGQSPAEVWQAIGQVANLVDDVPHTRPLSERRWEADGEIDRLGRQASRLMRGRRHA
jgi:hypothetical protein